MFIVSFPLLWWNEGRTDMSSVAKTAVVVPADGSKADGEGKLVSITGDLKTRDQVGDPDYIKPGTHLAMNRKVEMYAWVETKETKTEKQLGGGSKETTTWKYDLKWTDVPKSGDDFEHPEGHTNPPQPVASHKWFAKDGEVGAFEFAPSDIELPPAQPLVLNASIVKEPAPAAAPAPTTVVPPAKGKNAKVPTTKAVPKPPAKTPAKAAPSASASAKPDGEEDPDKAAEDEIKAALGGRGSAKISDGPAPPAKIVGTYLYAGRGTLETPKLGDVRIQYEVVEPAAGPFTLYGTRNGKSVVPYVHEPEKEKIITEKLYRVVVGTHEQAVATLHGEHVAMTWALRIIGFVMMWLGMALTVAPLNTVLDIVPFVGSAGRFITSVIMFPIALAMSVVTILISIVAHNPILLLVPILLIVGIFVMVRVMRKKKATA
jgi:hypothetical protein